jgi:hypothetical protein
MSKGLAAVEETYADGTFTQSIRPINGGRMMPPDYALRPLTPIVYSIDFCIWLQRNFDYIISVRGEI